MRPLQESLAEYDLHLLQIIANRWDVDLDTRDPDVAAEILAETMLEPEQATNEWDRLQDHERGALQMLIAVPSYRMPTAQIERLYGEIRQMGPDRRQREKPHLAPNGVAEILYYRGLLHLALDEGKAGVQSFAYVPRDLAAVLPTHQAGYDLSAPADDLPDMDFTDEPLLDELAQAKAPAHIQRADTTLVDDLTTLLAYLQVHQVSLEQGFIPEVTQQEIMQYLLDPTHDVGRFHLLLYLAFELNLVAESDGLVQVQPGSARPWLEHRRTEQVQTLVETWHKSMNYNELWYLPGVQPEGTGWRNDPTLLRQTLLETCKLLGSNDWTSIEALIEAIKESDPDFQRPGGDYTSWYIRDRTTGDYLQGFESWDRVEGAMLYRTITGPLYWLGLVDLGGDDEAQPRQAADAFKLTVYGKAWIGHDRWPSVRDPEAQLELDGRHISVPRAVSRYERFQLARFTEWTPPADPYMYVLSSDSLRHADRQGIGAERIQAFLQRVTGQPLPELTQSLLDWDTGSGLPAVLQRLVVLQLDTVETMQLVWETPEIRRFLGQKLGSLAVAVREDQWKALMAALEQRGIAIDNRL